MAKIEYANAVLRLSSRICYMKDVPGQIPHHSISWQVVLMSKHADNQLEPRIFSGPAGQDSTWVWQTPT